MGHSVSIGAEGNTKKTYRVSIGTTGHVLIGGKVVIGDNVNIDSGNDSDYGVESGIALGTGDVEGRGIIKIGQNVRIPNNLKFSISDNILTITDRTNTWKLTAES
jgi:acetyltransferase-like isoleucine patch superfamily enzyme